MVVKHGIIGHGTLLTFSRPWCDLLRSKWQKDWTSKFSSREIDPDLCQLDYEESLFRLVCHAWRERNSREKNGRAKSWGLGARERRDYCLSPRVCPFTAEWFLSVGFLILTSSYYRLLSIAPGDLNKIALLYSSSSQAKTYAVSVRSAKLPKKF